MQKLVLLLSFMLPLTVLADGPETAEAFWCRPPLNANIGATTHIYFNKAQIPAGNQGEALKPGECGWAKRAMTASDPSDYIIAYPFAYGPDGTPRESLSVGLNAVAIIAAIAPHLKNDQVLIYTQAYKLNSFLRTNMPVFLKMK